jgi:hypothetical protein
VTTSKQDIIGAKLGNVIYHSRARRFAPSMDAASYKVGYVQCFVAPAIKITAAYPAFFQTIVIMTPTIAQKGYQYKTMMDFRHPIYGASVLD